MSAQLVQRGRARWGEELRGSPFCCGVSSSADLLRASAVYLHRRKMDGSAREPVAAHLPVSHIHPPPVACVGKHIVASGEGTAIPYDVHHSLDLPCSERLLLPAPQAASGLCFVPPEGQQCPVERPVEPLTVAFAPSCEAKELVGTSGLPPRCKQAVPGAVEAVGPAPALPGSNQAMPRAAASFSFQEKDVAEPPAIGGSHPPPKTRQEVPSPRVFACTAQQQQRGTASSFTGCCLSEDQQQQEPCFSCPVTTPPRAVDGTPPEAAAAAARSPRTACGLDAADAASRDNSEANQATEVTLFSAHIAGVTLGSEGNLSSSATSKACVASSQGLSESPYGRIDSMNGSTYAAHEDEGGSQSLPSPGMDWPEPGTGAAAGATAAATGPTHAEDADATEDAGGVTEGAATSEGATGGERRRSHRTGRITGRSRSGRYVRIAAASAAPGVPGATEARRRGDGRTPPSSRRGKARRRSNKGRDPRRQPLQQQQQQPLRLTSEVLMQLEARTSRVETTVATTGGEALAAGGWGGGSMSFFWLVKQRAEQSREAAGDARRLAAFERAERAADAAGNGGPEALAAAAVAAAAGAAVDDCSSQSQRSSEVSTKGTVNHRCREDDVLINLCENPSDLWYGLRTQDGKPVVVHARPRHQSSRRHHRQRRPPVSEAAAVAAASAAASTAHQQVAAAALYQQQRVQQQILQQPVNVSRVAVAPPATEHQQHRQHQRRHHRHRSQKDPVRRQSAQRSSSQLPLQGVLPPPAFLLQQQLLQRQRGSTASWQQQQHQQQQPLQQQLLISPQQQTQLQQQHMQQQPLPPQQQMLQLHRADRKRRHKERKRGRSSSSYAAASSSAAGPVQQQQQQHGATMQQQLFPPLASKENRRSERRRRFHASRAGDQGQHGSTAVQQQGRQPDRVVFVHSPESGAGGSSNRTAASPRISSLHQLGPTLPPPASSAQPWAQQTRSFRGLLPPQRVAVGEEETTNPHPTSALAVIGVEASQQQQQSFAAAQGGEAAQLFRPARRPRLDDGTSVFSTGTPPAPPPAVSVLGRSWGAAPAAHSGAAAAGQGVFKPPAPLSASQRTSAKRRGLAARFSVHSATAGQQAGGSPVGYTPVGGPEGSAATGGPSPCGAAALSLRPAAVGSIGSSNGQQQQQPLVGVYGNLPGCMWDGRQQQQQQQQHPLPGVARPVPSYGDLDAADRLAQQPLRIVVGGSCGTALSTDTIQDPAAASQMGPGYHAQASVQAKQSHRMSARERVQWQLAKSRGML